MRLEINGLDEHFRKNNNCNTDSLTMGSRSAIVTLSFDLPVRMGKFYLNRLLLPTETPSVLVRRRNFAEHFPWIILLVVGTILSIAWYLYYINLPTTPKKPSGSHLPLFVFGIVGGAICLFEFLLWPRKKFRVHRWGRAKTWMRAHIWLGLLAVPLLILHSGFYFHNLEATILLVLFLIVIVSGLWGLTMQNMIPKKMLEEIPAETIYSQIDHVAGVLHNEADRLVREACDLPLDDEESEEEEFAAVQAELEDRGESSGRKYRSHLTIGAVRVVGGLQGKVVKTVHVPAVPNSEPLHEFFLNDLGPYLKQGKRSGSKLATVKGRTAVLEELQERLDPRAGVVLGYLGDICEQRRQFDYQRTLHTWLHSWLQIHLPLSIALIILMFVHVFKTLQYLWPGPIGPGTP